VQGTPMAGARGGATMPLMKAEEIPVGLVVPPRPAVVKDPVCGKELSEDLVKAGITSEYQGKTYYFCSVHYKEEFDRNPARYAAHGDGAAAGAPKTATSAQAGTSGGQSRD
jgi:YHS domain-containing protein